MNSAVFFQTSSPLYEHLSLTQFPGLHGVWGWCELCSNLINHFCSSQGFVSSLHIHLLHPSTFQYGITCMQIAKVCPVMWLILLRTFWMESKRFWPWHSILKVWSHKQVKMSFVMPNFDSKQYVTIQHFPSEWWKLHSYIIMTNSEYSSIWIMLQSSRFEKQVKGIAFSPPAPYSRQPKVIYFLCIPVGNSCVSFSSLSKSISRSKD